MSRETIELKLRSGLTANVLKKGRGAPLVFFHSHVGRTLGCVPRFAVGIASRCMRRGIRAAKTKRS